MTYGSIDIFFFSTIVGTTVPPSTLNGCSCLKYSPVIPARDPCVHLLQNAGVAGVKLVPASVAADMKDEWMLLLLQYSAR